MPKCRICKISFTPSRPLQPVCHEHQYQYALQLIEKKRANDKLKAKRETKEAKKAIERPKDLLPVAQQAVNAYVRKRDEKEGCISCDRPASWWGQFHAGHYRPAGNNSSLRFDLANIHKQCSICNNHMSGSLTSYRINLIEKIGLAEVERLEGPQPAHRWQVDELREIIKRYRLAIKTI